jgi:hypothetical protein
MRLVTSISRTWQAQPDCSSSAKSYRFPFTVTPSKRPSPGAYSSAGSGPKISSGAFVSARSISYRLLPTMLPGAFATRLRRT